MTSRPSSTTIFPMMGRLFSTGIAEFTVTNGLCVTAIDILSRLWGTASVTLGKIWCNLHPPISTMGRLWSTSRCAWHRCLKKRL